MPMAAPRLFNDVRGTNAIALRYFHGSSAAGYPISPALIAAGNAGLVLRHSARVPVKAQRKIRWSQRRERHRSLPGEPRNAVVAGKWHNSKVETRAAGGASYMHMKIRSCTNIRIYTRAHTYEWYIQRE